jgi:hypothetical protein
MAIGAVLIFISTLIMIVGVFCLCERYIMIGIIGILIGTFLVHDLPVLLGYESELKLEKVVEKTK